MTTAIYFLILAVICFLYTFNLFLRGSKKQQIEAILGIIIVLSVIGSFFVLGWRLGLLALISPFIFVGVFRPVAETVAFKLLGYRTGVDDDSAFDLDKVIGSDGEGFVTLMEKIGQDDKAAMQRLKQLTKSPEINFVLSRHGISFTMFHEVLRELRASSLHDLAWEIVSSPAELDQLFEMKSAGKSGPDIWAHFRNFKR